jgi:chromosome partitioning protein
MAEVAEGMYRVLIGETLVRDVVQSTSLEHLSIAPASRDLAGASLELASLRDAHVLLREAHAGVRGAFDDLLIDCPPSLDLLTMNGLTAADAVLVPVSVSITRWRGFRSSSRPKTSAHSA